jgi:uncharacterized protein (DUF2267 family)
MRYHELVERVEADAGLSREEAFRITDAVFSVLAQRLSFEEAHDVASQLPREVQAVMRPALKGSAPTDVPMTRDEFLEHVAHRADIPLDAAEPRARTVFATIRVALTDGEWADVTARLPDSFAPLLPGS